VIKLDKIGDVGGSGSVDVSDAVKTLRHIVGQQDLSEDQVERANTIGDDITIQDAVLILRYVSGLIDELPK